MVTNAGSLIGGALDGADRGPGTSGLAISTEIISHDESPDGVLMGTIGSNIVFDVANEDFYMCEAVGTTDWIRLVSGT